MAAKSVAIIGASSDRSKFGNKAVRAYAKRGWQVYPIHPQENMVEGLKVYRSVEDLPNKPDRVLLYIPASVGIKVLDELVAAGVADVFVNPGADSKEFFARAEELGIQTTLGCAIIDIGESPADY